jgi:putative transcriptional regulator
VPSLTGRLLVATPTLDDPNFFRTVVLVLHHDNDGALGVVLNRPSTIDLIGALPAWAPAAAHPPVVFIGGPVSHATAICLALINLANDPEGWQPVADHLPLGTLDLNKNPDDVLAGVERIRVFAGHAGWAPGQLEMEVAVGGWFVVDANPDDAMTVSPERLWQDVLRRQGSKLAMLAHFPFHPSMN